MSGYTVYILTQNIETKEKKLGCRQFSITEVDQDNLTEYRDLFGNLPVYKGEHVIERRHETVPELHDNVDDFAGLDRIARDSEDFMLLLRLFRAGDIVFVGQVIMTPEDGLASQVPYPMCFSNYPSAFTYQILEGELSQFDVLFSEARKWHGWGSSWFGVARNYFLWGGSKWFHPERANERVLDYMIALEAALVPEDRFVSRRLCERAAAILSQKGQEKLAASRRMKDYYAVRSNLAHGDRISNKQAEFLKTTHRLFEDDVRALLMETLKNCPAEDDARHEYLCQLFDITDLDMAKKIISDLGFIKNPEVWSRLLNQLSSKDPR